MKIFLIPIGILTLFVLIGCATIDVDSDWDTAADFSQLKTYNWTSASQEKTGDPRIDNDLLDSRIRRVVESVLTGKGYQKQTAGTPDFWVSYHSAVVGKLDATTIREPYYDATPIILPNRTIVYSGPASLWGQSTTFLSSYDEGTLILDIADSKTKKLLWRGVMNSVMEYSRTPEEKERRARVAIEKLLARFPPQ